MKAEKITDLRVLAVDDERIALSTVARMLDKLGALKVVEMGTAEEALAFVNEQPDAIDVVLVDMFMPGRDGVDVITGLKAAGYRGCVAVVSGGDERMLASAELLTKAKDLQFIGALKKPISSAELEDLLTRAISPAS